MRANEVAVPLERLINLDRNGTPFVKRKDTLERIEEFLDTETEKIKWHKTCYSAFTNVTFISRLKKRSESEKNH